MLSFSLAFLLSAVSVVAQNGPTNWTASPFNPPSLPLAVKSPYLNTWAPLGGGSAAVSEAWPRLWDAGLQILGWTALVRVDGTTYRLLGAAGVPVMNPAAQKSFIFTPTRTSYILNAGSVTVNMTFLSPIEATDLVRQSMPFSYMYITVESNDGSAHDVQVYSDLTGEWISGDYTLDSSWTINETSDFVYLQMSLTSPSSYQEILNRAQDATLYHCMKKTAQVSWQIGFADDMRGFFANGTGLNNTSVGGHHAIQSPFESLSIAYDLGSVYSTSDPVVYTIGVVRDPVIQYTNIKVQTEDRRAYYWSNFSSIEDVIGDVLDHFDDAVTASISLDSQILGDAGNISSNYSEVLSLSTRQAMGALEYTLLEDNGSGEFNMSDVKTFLKNMGNIGSYGVNSVDVLYAAMPVYLYLNPAILGYLLSPLMEYQESTQYQNQYAAQNGGTTFPSATGNYTQHNQQIEQSANMLIMSLAHAQASGDGSLLAQHYDLLSGWANYLVNNSMAPGDQMTSYSDGITSTNQANLALKGIIGIGAMAKISQYTGHSGDQTHFDGMAKQYSQQWTSLASASDHLDLTFGSSSSGLIYNLYADKLLQVNLFNSSVYDVQTTFYQEELSSRTYGIPLDSSDSSSLSRSDWIMFAAASVSSTSVRDRMISQVHAYASPNKENLPFDVLYNPSTGSQAGGPNSPAQGAMFAPLALNIPVQSVTFKEASSTGVPNSASTEAPNGTSGHKANHKANVGVVAGAAVGGIALVAIVVGALIFFCRRRGRQSTKVYGGTDLIDPATFASDSMAEYRSSTVRYGQNAAPYPAIKSRRLSRSEIVGAGDDNDSPLATSSRRGFGSSSGAGSAQAVIAPYMAIPNNGLHPEELRSDVDNLRREIERIREERSGLGEAPPSYDELLRALGSPITR